MSIKTVAFNKSGISQLPDNKSVVYKIQTTGGKNNYTGIAERGRVQDRLAEHLKGAKDAVPGTKVQIEQMPSIRDARAREGRVIARSKPRYNKQGKQVQIMPNAYKHRVIACLSVTAATVIAGKNADETFEVDPIVAGGVAAVCGTLPDIIEPATSPEHRKFFHSWCAGGAVCYGLYHAWQWHPETEFQKLLKTIAIGAGGAYLVHLFMDSRTPKGLPAF